MDKVTLKPTDELKIELAMEVSNVSLLDVGMTAQANDPFAKLNFTADKWKAYMDFDIVHCCPAILGPVQEGFYCTYLPQVVQASHGSLLHQQMNLNHLLKAYSGGEAGEIAKDRIVGCVVATYFPPAPMAGWKIGDDPNAAPSIRARAVVFKLADGVNRMLGDHQASRKKQSVSIETITTLGNLGIYLPSRGPDGIVPMLGVQDEAIIAALQLSPLKLGKVDGEQGVFVYGMKDPVEFRGVGITPRPAEREAKIISFAAQRSQTPDGGTIIAMAAEKVDEEMVGRKIKFESSRVGTIREVHTEGKIMPPGKGFSMKATKDEPVVRIEMPDKRVVLRRLSEVADRIGE